MSHKLDAIQKKLRKAVSNNIVCCEQHNSIVLEGKVKSWEDIIKAGQLAANKGYKGVVNKIEVEKLIIPKIKKPVLKDNFLHNKKTDVLIIGGGIIGCAIARELSKWNISVLLVDKEEDVAMHASSRNDGMIHPGLQPKPGSKKALFNSKGNQMYTQITKELDVPFKRIGSVILLDKRWYRIFAPIVKTRAKKNGVKGIRLMSKNEVKKREPFITDNFETALLMPTTGILSPYKMTIAYAENAVLNGAKVSLNTIVLSMKKQHGKIISVKTNRGTIYPKVVINAAGVYSDEIAKMSDDQFFTIHPRKGEIIFFDKKKGHFVNSVIAKPSLSTTKSTTKGGGVVKTIDDNILLGPSAYEVPFKEDYSTDSKIASSVIQKHMPIIPKLSHSDIITYCAGTRAATYEEDFIVEKSEYVENLVYAAGIQSPGVASAPAISQEIEKITCKVLSSMKEVKPNPNWNPYRKGIPQINKMSIEKRREIIKKRPDYGTIICRCEEISKGEIIDAIHSPIPVKTVDGIKRRVRAGMGRCQGGFCTPLVMQILRDETKMDMSQITKKGNLSNMVIGETKLNAGG